MLPSLKSWYDLSLDRLSWFLAIDGLCKGIRKEAVQLMRTVIAHWKSQMNRVGSRTRYVNLPGHSVMVVC